MSYDAGAYDPATGTIAMSYNAGPYDLATETIATSYDAGGSMIQPQGQ